MKILKQLARMLLLATTLGSSLSTVAQPAPPSGSSGDRQLNAWPFQDTNWLSSAGYAPVNFTNIVNVTGGDGTSLWLDTTNTTPAFLFYNTVETNGFTNLVCSAGTISLWFNPDWSSTNQDGGTGPGDWANLISLGAVDTKDSSWWAWYLSPDGCTVYFAAQTNSGTASNYLSAPISLIGSNWYNLTLTYSATNSAFYTNGVLVTNGTGVAYWPESDVSFFSIGSDSNGLYQAGGRFDDVTTYNYPLDTNYVSGMFGMYSLFYYAPGHMPHGLTNAASAPPATVAPRWFTGSGLIQYVSSAATCTTSSNMWLTNVSATLLTNGTTAITFTIQGGSNAVPYDVFGTTALMPGSATNSQWAWLGQGYHCSVYTITNLSYSTAFLMLGAAKDTDGDGLPDAFEILVSKTNPSLTNSFGGLPDAWVALNGLVGSTNLASLDPDLDGLNNRQEYLYGTKPLVSEGFNIWVGNPAGFSGIP